MKKVDINKQIVKLGIYDSEISDTEIMNSDFCYKGYSGKTIVINNNELTEEDVKLSLLAEQTRYLKSIRAIMIFFTVLTIAGFFWWLYVAFTYPMPQY